MMTGRYGYNVYPTQVEDALYQHPDFREAAAIDVSNSFRGETVKAIVALKEGAAPLLLEDLKMFLIDKLAPIEMPKFFGDHRSNSEDGCGKGLPKTASASRAGPVCTENLIRVDNVTEPLKLSQ
jgi:acyl-CoA synthetase (AMP-forming)/AMP-acid ligase II